MRLLLTTALLYALPALAQETTVQLPGDAEMAMVWIEPGSFQMGSPAPNPFRQRDEEPAREVTISRGFYLGKFEITQAQWQAVMDARPWSGRDFALDRPDHPAVYISWEDVQAFIDRLNAAEGAPVFRLPTEAEWEYAARAGTTTHWSFGDAPDAIGDFAWFRGNAWDRGERYGHSVGAKRPNPWGLFDMHGNVWEWVQDWYWTQTYAEVPPLDPRGPPSGVQRVLRGGTFFYEPAQIRSANRHSIEPDERNSVIGARLVKQLPAETAVEPLPWGGVKTRVR